MPSTRHRPDVSNWVDRGEPVLPQLVHILRHFLGPEREIAESSLEDYARDIEGLVGGHATERHVSGYLRRLGEELGIDETELPPRRMTAAALWHVAKVALVRDEVVRLRAGLPRQVPAPQPRLSEWLASRLLTEDELLAWQRERGEGGASSSDEE